MFKKKVSLLLAFVMVVSLLVPQILANTTTPEEGYRKLLDHQIFKDQPVAGWSGSGGGELEVVNSTLPVDSDVTYKGLPSLRLNVTSTGQWWVSLLTFRGWNTHDLTQYVPNGHLEFNIKGKNGGESFEIGARDKVYERSIGLEFTITKPITDYVTITDEWQQVKIPLIDIMDPAQGYSPLDSLCLILERLTNEPFTVWINDMKITSPDNEKSFPEIKVNQVGFLTNMEKFALVTGFPEVLTADVGTGFSVVNTSNGSIAYEGSLILLSEFEANDSGEKILKADFSDLKIPGEYYIKVDADGIENSLNFMIGEDIYNSLLIDSSRYFYYQRQGIELVPPFAPDYPRSDKTPQDSAAVFRSGTRDPIDVTKGWYDAGDYGKYVNAGATGVSDLFWAYEMFPSQFRDDQFNIPESGNGIPDILDEARWQLEWMLKMQDEESGGFFPRVQSNDDNNVTQRIIMDQNGPTTDDTACAAAILAHAYIIYKDIDSDFAQECLSAAKKAWNFLENNPNNIVSPSGPYNVRNDRSNRLWAAASLLRATDDSVYNEYFLDNYQSFSSKFRDDWGYAHGWGDMWLTAFFMYYKAESRQRAAINWINTELDVWLEKMITRYEKNPWYNAIVPGNYFWGINKQVLNVPMSAIIASSLRDTYTDRIANFGLGSLGWVLGANPLRLSFVSGFGEDSIEEIFSTIYNNDGKPGIPKGYLAGGPNRYEGEGLSRFAAKCYTRSAGDWVSNEHTVYWNSPLVFMAAYANNKASSEADFKYGDVNGDGKVDSSDYILIRRHVLNISSITDPIAFKAADVNGDGNINTLDVVLMRRYILEIIDMFPVE
ncbi:UNVERIFIED_CONTAM: dockerin type I repeat protein [Acetivibrio alkalicellulosi]